MPTTLLIEGQTGTGKSTSLENLPPEKTLIFSPNGKPLPFPGSRKAYVEGKNHFTSSSLTKLNNLLGAVPEKRPEVEYIVIDDFTHYLNSRMMDDSFITNKDWGKWNIYGKDVLAVIQTASERLPNSIKAVIFIHHTSRNEDGIYSFRSSGKLLEQTLEPVSYFTYVLHSIIRQKEEGQVEYLFLTNGDGFHEAKTPKGCFTDRYIPNDVMEAIKTIKIYEGEEINEVVESDAAAS